MDRTTVRIYKDLEKYAAIKPHPYAKEIQELHELKYRVIQTECGIWSQSNPDLEQLKYLKIIVSLIDKSSDQYEQLARNNPICTLRNLLEDNAREFKAKAEDLIKILEEVIVV